jgi:hypothetical protein
MCRSEADGSYCGCSRRQLGLSRHSESDSTVGPILDAGAGQHPAWKDTADHRPTLKDYWAKCEPLAVRDGILEHHWESTNRLSKIALRVLHRRKVKDVLAKLHGGLSGGHLDVSKTLDNYQQRYY